MDGAERFHAFLPVSTASTHHITIVLLTFAHSNHYGIGKSAQEAYVWPSVANASRAAIAIRYSLLNYLYTLMYAAHTHGDTVLRALAWEFPDDFSLRATDTQFLFGPSLLISPVLTQGATTVGAVFPGIGEGERWYDWYDLQEVKGVKSGENVTLNAPLEKIRVHIRGGSILPLQAPGNTTTATRGNPFAFLIALDSQGAAKGSLYLDDGESIEPPEMKVVEVSCICFFIFKTYVLTGSSANSSRSLTVALR